jgi:tRNA modification GTPase
VVRGGLRLAGTAVLLPCEVYRWASGRSYTRQSVVEVHTLGSPPLLEAAVAAFCAAGARLAEPGEFTLRAFLAGRLDLVQAEAVLGVIDAGGPDDLKVALEQLAGGVARPLGELRDRLVDLLAQLEAGLDFADEDLPPPDREQLGAQLEEAGRIVQSLAAQMESRARTGAAVRVVLSGGPNAGKSSLFNALLGCPDALVSDLPGTTRDYLTAELDLDGVRCQLIDTAGVARESSQCLSAVDRAAQDAGAEQLRQSHVVVCCLDATRPVGDLEFDRIDRPTARRIVVLTKIDAAQPVPTVSGAIPTSSVTGEGLGALRAELSQAVREVESGGCGVVSGTATRCREALRVGLESISQAQALTKNCGGDELIAVELRSALEELGKVVGAVYTDDVLDRVFSRFCIGK